MVTGYTAAIEEGCTFKEYAMGCARAFDACITMRDDRSDAKIPEKFNPSDYYLKQVSKCEADLARLKSLPEDEAKAEESREREGETARREAYRVECERKAQRYERIREDVVAWTPPEGDEHDDFKAFMLSQIDLCLPNMRMRDGFWTELVEVSGSEWRARQVTAVEENIAYAREQYAKECNTAAGRTKWVTDLRVALEA